MSFTPETLLRHWQTLRLIPRHPRKITAGDLCQHLGREGFTVGKRTVERDLQALSRIFPLVSDERSKPFGWSWDKEAPAFDLPGLSTNEALTLLMAKEHLCSVMPSTTVQQLETYFRQAENRINSVPGHNALTTWMDKVRIVQPTQPLLAPDIKSEVISTVQDALLNDRQCRVTYQKRGDTEGEAYPVNPLGLVQRGQVLYLVATIKTYLDVRLLAIHRILAAEPVESQSVRPAGFNLDSYLASGAFGWGPGGAIRLKVLFQPAVGSHLYETPLSEDQVITVETDSQLHVTATVQDTLQLLWWLQGFGDGVEVLEPQSLRERIFDHLSRAARRYSTST